jgi:hypothetical protein
MQGGLRMNQVELEKITEDKIAELFETQDKNLNVRNLLVLKYISRNLLSSLGDCLKKDGKLTPENLIPIVKTLLAHWGIREGLRKYDTELEGELRRLEEYPGPE